MNNKLCPVLGSLLFWTALNAAQATEAPPQPSSEQITLTIPSGAPLRVYLTKRLWKRLNAPVQAKLIEPLFAFDKEVAPAGSEVLGRVIRLDSVTKMKRAQTILAGDFTPLHQAQVEFTTLVLSGGRQIPLETVESSGLNSIYRDSPPQKAKAAKPPKPAAQPPKPSPDTANAGVLDNLKTQAKDQIRGQINGQINARTRGVADMVRGPDKKDRLTEYLLMKLPYHPQWVRKGTRFDAELRDPLQFGVETVTPDALRLLASQPPADSVVHGRLITPLNSGDAKQGEKVEAVVSQPLFSPDQKLILPAGTRLTGAVTAAHRGRWFHRGGQLRFNFQTIEMPEGVELPAAVIEKPAIQTQAQLGAAESAGRTAIKVDKEGGVKATEPKTRFIAPALSFLVAAKASDNDTGKRTGQTDSNATGRTLGGGSGFGLLGAISSHTSPSLATALGYYGLAWSVYLNIVARGSEVEFARNAAVDIRFGSRAPAAGSKVKADTAPEP